ncbi:MAG: aminopeptidase P family protein [Oscillospiraceae bacterium]|nr:aminopeptidase P family protein [Oscillospiraceae bacterium]
MITKRISEVRRKLRQKDEAPAFIVTSEQNRRYLTNLAVSNAYIIITPENKYFFTDSRYIEIAEKTLGDYYIVELFPEKNDAQNYYRELLKREKISNILYEENYIYLRTKKYFDELFGGFKLCESGNLLENMRKVKDFTEIENIAKAQKITDLAFTHILKVISSGLNSITETDIAVELEYFMKKNGAEKSSFDTIAVSGKKSSYPHGKPENIKLSKGFLLMDFGAVYNGYCSDMTRTVCIGSPGQKMRDVYNTVKSAQTAAIDRIKAGVNGREADKAARNIIKNAGCGENFGHNLGHSLGLEIHESPSLLNSDKEETDKIILEENMIMTVEPGIYLENNFGVRIEDLVVVKKDGCLNLTESVKELIEL